MLAGPIVNLAHLAWAYFNAISCRVGLIHTEPWKRLSIAT